MYTQLVAMQIDPNTYYYAGYDSRWPELSKPRVVEQEAVDSRNMVIERDYIPQSAFDFGCRDNKPVKGNFANLVSSNDATREIKDLPTSIQVHSFDAFNKIDVRFLAKPVANEGHFLSGQRTSSPGHVKSFAVTVPVGLSRVFDIAELVKDMPALKKLSQPKEHAYRLSLTAQLTAIIGYDVDGEYYYLAETQVRVTSVQSGIFNKNTDETSNDLIELAYEAFPVGKTVAELSRYSIFSDFIDTLFMGTLVTCTVTRRRRKRNAVLVAAPMLRVTLDKLLSDTERVNSKRFYTTAGTHKQISLNNKVATLSLDQVIALDKEYYMGDIYANHAPKSYEKGVSFFS